MNLYFLSSRHRDCLWLQGLLEEVVCILWPSSRLLWLLSSYTPSLSSASGTLLLCYLLNYPYIEAKQVLGLLFSLESAK